MCALKRSYSYQLSHKALRHFLHLLLPLQSKNFLSAYRSTSNAPPILSSKNEPVESSMLKPPTTFTLPKQA